MTVHEDHPLYQPLAESDPEVAAAVDAELRRQQSTLETVSYTHLTLPTIYSV